MSLADKIVKVAIDGMPINPLEKLFIKFVLGTKLGRKILLRRMKKNWKSAFGKKGKVDKKKADKAAKGQVDKGKVAKGQEVDKGKVAKGIVSTNKKRWPTIFDRVVLDEKPNTPRSPYEVHLNGENIVSDKEENETSELLRKILLITKPKALGEGIVSDKDAEMPEMLRKILSLGAVVEPKTPKNPYEVRIDGKLKTAQEILKDITNTSLKDALKDMHREKDYKVLHDILGDNINVKIESLEDLYFGKKTKQTDDQKGKGYDPKGLKPWQIRLPDGTIYAMGALLPNDPRWAADDQNGFKFVDGQMILPDGTVVKLETPGAEKIQPTKEQIVNPDQNKKLEKNPWVIHSKEQIINPDQNKKQEKNPWVIHLDKIAQNFQKHEDYFKQKYGLTLDGGAIMPAPRTNDISSTLVATKGGRQ